MERVNVSRETFTVPCCLYLECVSEICILHTSAERPQARAGASSALACGRSCSSYRVSPVGGMVKASGDNSNRDNPNGEANIIISIAEARARYASDPRFLEERECVFSRSQLAPVVNSSIIIDVNVCKQV